MTQMFKCCQVARACSKSFSAVAGLGTQASKGPLACHIAKSQTLTSISRMRPLTYQASSIFCGHTSLTNGVKRAPPTAYVWEVCTKILDDFCGFRAGLRDFAFGMASWWQFLGPFAAGALLIRPDHPKYPNVHDSCVAQTKLAHTLTKHVCILNTCKKSFKDSCIWSCAWNSAASTKSSLVRLRPAVGHGRFSDNFYWFLTLCLSFKFVSSEVPGCPLPFLRAGSHELLAWVRNKSPIQWFGSTAKDDKKTSNQTSKKKF